MSVISEFCLSSSLSVVCVLAPAYTSLCRGLKYLPKVSYIILVDPLRDRFLIIETVFLGRSETLPYVWKIHHRNEWHLHLVAPIFTKLSQSVCLINIHIFIYWHARCDVFWAFSYIIIDHLCLNFHQTFTNCVSNQYDVSKYQMWLQFMKCLLILLRLLQFLLKIDEYWCLNCCISTKLLRIVCLINTFILICW